MKVYLLSAESNCELLENFLIAQMTLIITEV